jgi:hypothetical protein
MLSELIDNIKMYEDRNCDSLSKLVQVARLVMAHFHRHGDRQFSVLRKTGFARSVSQVRNINTYRSLRFPLSPPPEISGN